MKNKAVYIALAVVTVLLIIACIFLLLPDKSDGSEGMGLTVDPNSGIYVAPEKTETEDAASGIAIPGWGSITIPANTTAVDVNLKNPSENEGKYNMTFTLTLDGEEEPLAETGLIRPGESALKLNLSRPLEAGEYKAYVHVQPYRISDNSATNNANIGVTLIVK